MCLLPSPLCNERFPPCSAGQSEQVPQEQNSVGASSKLGETGELVSLLWADEEPEAGTHSIPVPSLSSAGNMAVRHCSCPLKLAGKEKI